MTRKRNRQRPVTLPGSLQPRPVVASTAALRRLVAPVPAGYVWSRGVLVLASAVPQYALAAWLGDTLQRIRGDVTLIQGGGGVPTPVWTTSLSRSGSWRILHATDDHTPLGYVSDGRNEHEHIARLDPRTVLDQVDAHGRILARHLPVPDHGRFSHEWTGDGQHCSYSGRDPRECHGDGDPVCRTCRDSAGDPYPASCEDLLDLAACYQHEPGYLDEWRTS